MFCMYSGVIVWGMCVFVMYLCVSGGLVGACGVCCSCLCGVGCVWVVCGVDCYGFELLWFGLAYYVWCNV